MEPIPNNHSDAPGSGAKPPILPKAEAPAMAPPPLSNMPPSIGTRSGPKTARYALAVVLSLSLALFLADALVSFLDDSLILIFGVHLLTGLRGLVFVLAMLSSLVVYALMAITPSVSKRLFLPIALFNVAAGLVFLLVIVCAYDRIKLASWAISLCEVLVALFVLYQMRHRLTFQWPLVPERRVQGRAFSGLNLCLFLLVNVCVLVPGVLAYLALCTSLAIGHYSEGFLALRPSGLTVQARKYVRSDGKTIELVPMAHVGDRSFYRQLSASFPTNAVILMEGVTDRQNLLTNHITYHGTASSLHLAEQQREFRPPEQQLVWGDIDVDQFRTNTIGFINLVMLVHTKGLTVENVLWLLQYSPPPHFEQDLFDDLLRKRNRRVLEEVQTQLAEADYLILPWGVAHMPELAAEVQKAGFRLEKTREYQVIRFGAYRDRGGSRP